MNLAFLRAKSYLAKRLRESVPGQLGCRLMDGSKATISSADAGVVIGLTAVVAGYALVDRTDLLPNEELDSLLMDIRDRFAMEGLLPTDADCRALATALRDLNHRFRAVIGEEG